jgi:hypothetical protein
MLKVQILGSKHLTKASDFFGADVMNLNGLTPGGYVPTLGELNDVHEDVIDRQRAIHQQHSGRSHTKTTPFVARRPVLDLARLNSVRGTKFVRERQTRDDISLGVHVREFPGIDLGRPFRPSIISPWI